MDADTFASSLILYYPFVVHLQLWKGACNKNLGNSFLLIWRIGEEEKLLSVSRTLWSAGGTHMHVHICASCLRARIPRKLVCLFSCQLRSNFHSTITAATASTAAAGNNLTHLDVRRIPGACALRRCIDVCA